MKVSLTKGTNFRVKGTRHLGLTPKGRIMTVPFDQTTDHEGPNTYHDLYLLHTRGPMKGITIHFNKTKLFVVKDLDLCNCDRYNYPHKKGMGRCKG